MDAAQALAVRVTFYTIKASDTNSSSFMSWYCKDDFHFVSTPAHWMRYFLHSWVLHTYKHWDSTTLHHN